MSYIFETVSDLDRKKILKDLLVDENKRKWIVATKCLDAGQGMSWVVDRETYSYAFLVPGMREDSDKSIFYFFYYGCFYEVYVEGLFGDEVHFVGRKPSTEVQPKVLNNLEEALTKLGRFGQGGKDSLDKISPTFKEEN